MVKTMPESKRKFVRRKMTLVRTLFVALVKEEHSADMRKKPGHEFALIFQVI